MQLFKKILTAIIGILFICNIARVKIILFIKKKIKTSYKKDPVTYKGRAIFPWFRQYKVFLLFFSKILINNNFRILIYMLYQLGMKNVSEFIAFRKRF